MNLIRNQKARTPRGFRIIIIVLRNKYSQHSRHKCRTLSISYIQIQNYKVQPYPLEIRKL
jgi:hypothetical protein